MRKIIHLTVLLAVALFLSIGLCPIAHSDPSVSGGIVLTSNMGTNDLGIPTGHRFDLDARGVTDPLGPENVLEVIATALTAGQPDYSLSGYLYLSEPEHYGVFPPYYGQLGRWSITVRNHQEETSTPHITNELDKPLLIPLAENVQLSDNSITPTVTWDPVFFDDDLNPTTPDIEVDFYRVRFETALFNRIHISPWLESEYSYIVPYGILRVGQFTSVRVEAYDIDEEQGNVENKSNSFISFVPEPLFLGDIDVDHDVDASDLATLAANFGKMKQP